MINIKKYFEFPMKEAPLGVFSVWYTKPESEKTHQISHAVLKVYILRIVFYGRKKTISTTNPASSC